MSMIFGLLSGVGGKLLGIVALAVGALGFLWKVQKSGRDAQQAADLARQAKETEVANEASSSVDGKSDAAVHSELQQFDRD